MTNYSHRLAKLSKDEALARKERSKNSPYPNVPRSENDTSVTTEPTARKMCIRDSHMAMTGFLGEKWRYDLMLTLCKNYGTYTANHGGRFEWSDLNPNFDPRNNPFHHIPKQVHSFLRLTHDLATTMKKHKLMASLSVAFDHGDMYTSAGLLGSIKYTM